jgi:hypothetical protein
VPATADLSSCSPLVRVWTVVHGQLITVARQSLLLNLHHSPDEPQPEAETEISVGEPPNNPTEVGQVPEVNPGLSSEDNSPMDASGGSALGQPFAAALNSFLSASRDTLLGATKTTSKSVNRSTKNRLKCAAGLRSVSESNLVLKERRAAKFNRKSTGRQSLPQV